MNHDFHFDLRQYYFLMKNMTFLGELEREATLKTFRKIRCTQQGFVLTPTLVGIFSAVLHRASHDDDKSVIADGVFYCAPVLAECSILINYVPKQKFGILVRDLLFADDIAFTSHSEIALKHQWTVLAFFSDMFWF